MNNVKGFPNISIDKNIFFIEFARPNHESRVLKSWFVFDYNQYQEIIGLEIINLKLISGNRCLEKLYECFLGPQKYFKCSYDSETDSFYLTLSNDRSLDQKEVEGNIILDGDGHIVALRADLRYQ